MKAKRFKKTRRAKKRKSSKYIKTVLSIMCILLIIIIVFSLLIKHRRNENSNENKFGDLGLLKEKVVFDMKIKDVSIEQKEGIYTFKAKVINTSNKDFQKEKVYIIFKSEEEKQIIKYPYVILDLKKNQTQDIEINTSEDLTKYDTFDVKIQK